MEQKSMEQSVLSGTFSGAEILRSDCYLLMRMETFFKHGFCSRKFISPAFHESFRSLVWQVLFCESFKILGVPYGEKIHILPCEAKKQIPRSNRIYLTLPVVGLSPHTPPWGLCPHTPDGDCANSSVSWGASPQTPCFPREEKWDGLHRRDGLSSEQRISQGSFHWNLNWQSRLSRTFRSGL